jgi:hypothetical protein
MSKRIEEEKQEDNNPFIMTPPPVEDPKPEPEPSKKKGNVRIVREEGPGGVKVYEYRD